MGRRLLLACAVVFVAGAAAPAALACHPTLAGFEKSEQRLTMDDGASIATTLYVPREALGGCDHRPVPTPAIVMFHGLGGSRRDMNLIAESSFANQGYVVLTFDTRGHGESTGLWSLVGPRELADFRTLIDWLGSRPVVDAAHVGAWGISLGGGAVWRSVAEGLPLAAVETVETWTDLESALLPQGLSKSGLAFGFLNLVPADRQAPEIHALRDDALNSTNLPALRAFAASRSTRSALSSIRTPAFVFQGRRDFAFGLDQGLETYRRLAGPKRLYVGAFGHVPSTFPGPDVNVVLAEGGDWFARFLKGQPNGIDTRPPVELAPDPFLEAQNRSYAGLPPTRTLTYAFRGRARTIGPLGKVVRAVGPTRGVLETFGAPVVRVQASGSFDRIVAVLTATRPNGTELVVSAGGAKVALTGQTHAVAIRLISQVTTIPPGSRLRLTLGASSTVAGGNLLYLTGVRAGQLRVGAVTMTLPVLQTPISQPRLLPFGRIDRSFQTGRGEDPAPLNLGTASGAEEPS
jgi:predicted acyl esterase